MESRAKFINYKGKEIYFIDYTNLKKTEDFLNAIKGTNAFREKQLKVEKRNY
jgi:hypothetical protein